MAKIGQELCTGVIYYSDKSRKVYYYVLLEILDMVEGGFVTILPDDLAEEGV